MMETENSRKRGKYGADLKAQIPAECDAPGASVAEIPGGRSSCPPRNNRTVPVQFEDILVIGAGPAGLTTSACLRHEGRAHVVLEREVTIGSAWHRHYDG